MKPITPKQKNFITTMLLDRKFKNFLRKYYKGDKNFAYHWDMMERVITNDKTHYDEEMQELLNIFRSDYVKYKTIYETWGTTYEELYGTN